MAFGLTTCTSNPLADYLTTLIIHHTFMSHFLVTCARVFIHLVTLSDLISLTKSSLGFILVSFPNRIAVLAWLCCRNFLHLSEPTLTWASLHHLHGLCHWSLHIVPHFTYHIIHITEWLFEKRIVCERITPSKALEHITHHLVHLMMLILHSLHDSVQGRTSSTVASHLVAILSWLMSTNLMVAMSRLFYRMGTLLTTLMATRICLKCH